MMLSPAFASAKNMMRDLAAKEHEGDPDTDPAMHPLAAEEWLASFILASLADPRAVCELALINKNFYSASQSNLVWDKLLPPPSHFESLLEERDDASLHESASLSRKDLYFLLCKSISFDGGLKKFWLDRRTGGECYMLSARSLAIAWGNTPEYWAWLPCPGAWFPEVAVLNSVCWFDLSGKFRQQLRPGSYVLSFRMQVRSASIWRWSPIKLCLQNMTYAQPPIKSRAFFHRRLPISDPPLTSPPTPDAGQPSANDSQHDESAGHHVWVECDVGRFTVEENEVGPVEVDFSMREVEVLGWKSGFLLDGVLIRPSYVVDAQERATVSMGSLYGYEDEDEQDMLDVENGETGGYQEIYDGDDTDDNGNDKTVDDDDVGDVVESFSNEEEEDRGRDSRNHSDQN